MSHNRRIRWAATGSALVLLASAGISVLTALPAAAATCTSGVDGDVNGDGYAEVAVSETGPKYGEGAVHVFYGRAKGLAASASGQALNDQYLDQDQPGVPGGGADYDDFGTVTTFGDFNDDGCADLAVGAVGDHLAGSVYVFYGSKSGLKTTGSKRITSAQAFGSESGHDDAFGGALVAGDLNDDGVTDLAVGASYRRVGDDQLLGAVAVLFGGSAGLTTSSRAVVDRDTAGVAEEAGLFGQALAFGDFNGNGRGELAISIQYTGVVPIVEGTSSGFTPAQAQPLTGPGLGVDDLVVGDDGEEDQRVFGNVMAAGDVNADGRDDLAVGMPSLRCTSCPGQPSWAGAVVLVKGSTAGLTASGLQTFNQGTAGVDGVAAEDDGFGESLAMGRLDAGTTDDLAIGTPWDWVGAKAKVGTVTVLLGSASGLTTAGAGGSRFHQDVAGIAGSAENGDAFGRTLAIANVQSKTQGSLVIGAEQETIGTVKYAGQFHQLSISSSGPKGAGSVTLHLNSAGVKGTSIQGSTFGKAVS